jgi:Xaa-Pro aminopeptidase
MSENTSVSVQAQRLDRLRAALDAAGLDGAVISRPQHLFYFTGQRPGKDPAFLVVTPNVAAAVAPAPVPGLETTLYTNYDIHTGWSAPENAAAALERVLAALSIPLRRIGFEPGYLGALFLPLIQKAAREQVEIKDLLWNARKIRDAGEIAQIETNVAVNDQIFTRVQAALRPGGTDFELWALVYRMLSEAGGEPVALEADLAVGQYAFAESKPAGHVLQAGDAVLLDVYSPTHGYYADTTRVFTLGRPSPKQREIHSILVDAIAAGQEKLRPGVRACDIDRAVRGVIERAGYGPNFGHHSGHAYNFFQQDKPYFIPAEPTPIEAGMVVTLEPGIYLPAWGGMRLERNYLVGETETRILDRFPIELPG